MEEIKEPQKILEELIGSKPEQLTGEAKRLFEAIMKIADERDELLKERQADKEKIKELEEIEKIHQEENGELRKEINEENKRCMILAVENQDLKEKRISKDKIRTRIDEIQSKINNGKTDYCVIDFEFQIKMLQELLKDGGE